MVQLSACDNATEGRNKKCGRASFRELDFQCKLENRYLFAALHRMYSDIDTVYHSCSMLFHRL
jgi:hypothetical protein